MKPNILYIIGILFLYTVVIYIISSFVGTDSCKETETETETETSTEGTDTGTEGTDTGTEGTETGTEGTETGTEGTETGTEGTETGTEGTETGTEGTETGTEGSETGTEGTPVDCVGRWDVEPCSEECGGGLAPQTYRITTPASNGGVPCEYVDGQLRSEPCNIHACLDETETVTDETAVDCVGDWYEGPCSAECGGGLARLFYHITTQASNGGTQCGPSEGDVLDTFGGRPCNTQPCPDDTETTTGGDALGDSLPGCISPFSDRDSLCAEAVEQRSGQPGSSWVELCSEDEYHTAVIDAVKENCGWYQYPDNTCDRYYCGYSQHQGPCPENADPGQETECTFDTCCPDYKCPLGKQERNPLNFGHVAGWQEAHPDPDEEGDEGIPAVSFDPFPSGSMPGTSLHAAGIQLDVEGSAQAVEAEVQCTNQSCIQFYADENRFSVQNILDNDNPEKFCRDAGLGDPILRPEMVIPGPDDTQYESIGDTIDEIRRNCCCPAGQVFDMVDAVCKECDPGQEFDTSTHTCV